ncbi:RNA polymerase subunit sigma-24 [Devosia limi DSM 17137]|uniref:RNA polymerase subunit sigma-24 n=1 Tax=Devosia limi DSM 17137 TaxID=1121477 RepID=A0A0F5LTT7_9HYPH|nr:RNA polymerase sigma factor [Devosia limi]KKB85062.1 RNA polymerase subunit sigma-24 [Devosia limi DSM 17137]SHF39134.1 RNA polymerase, sigma subunit, ECF family [Devosia limi DSM 17137]
MPENATARIEAIYRAEAPRVLATLIRLLDGFDRAEEALHDAAIAALDQWPRQGIPANPRAWLVSAGRFKAIDRIRRDVRFDAVSAQLVQQLELATLPDDTDTPAIADDQLRLIFTCCHPALSPDAQVALTLREIAGLTTEDIAAAYLVPSATIAQRIVRAKAKIRDAGIPYTVPEPADLPDRIEAVLQVLYLIFNAGYSAGQGDTAIRADLCAEAIRLCRLLVGLVDEPEAFGLLALMLLNDARRPARLDASGDLVPLTEQDRSRWHHAQIAEGAALVQRAIRDRRIGAYSLQAAIAAAHSQSPNSAATNWAQIVLYYDLLLRLEPSDIIALNRAVAVGMRDGPQAGLALADAILASGDLDDYHLAHATRADFLARLNRPDEAAAAYRLALELTRQAPERRFLQKRLDALSRR